MDLSFVILTWNSEVFIERCLDSIFGNVSSRKFEFEIFVVDNGSVDSTRRLLDSYLKLHPETIQTVYLDENQGTTYSRNLAFERTTGDYVVVMDSDVELLEHTIEQLTSMLQDDAHIGLVAPKLIYPNGEIQKSTDNFPTLASKLKRFFFLKSMEKKLQDIALPQEVDYAISAMWVLRRELFDKVGYLDENIFYAPEDADYCLSCWRSGYKILYCPQAVAMHHTQELSRGFKLNKAKLEHLRGLVYYFRKHGYLFSAPEFA